MTAAVVDAEVMAVEEVAVAMVVEDTEVADDFGWIRLSRFWIDAIDQFCCQEKLKCFQRWPRWWRLWGRWLQWWRRLRRFVFVSDLLSPSHKYFDP